MRSVSAIFMIAMMAGTSAMSEGLLLQETRYALMLSQSDATEIKVGEIAFKSVGEAQFTYQIDWDDSKFTDQFLSMRPFQCLEGVKKQWCRVPYPYENNRVVSVEDLTDLEYDLLFIWKSQGDYGINMWNGVYYDLSVTGTGLWGQMNEMDMDILSAPPDDGVLRPIGEFDLELADPESHWLPNLSIKPM